MNLIKRVVLLVGVTLSVTPIFSSAQVNNDARLLTELQALRGEIAELRDMIERQQYELQKMKRAQQSTGTQQGSSNVNSPNTYTTGPAVGAPSGSSTIGTSIDASGNATTSSVNPAFDNQINAGGRPDVPVAGQATRAETDRAYPGSDAGFYRPLDDIVAPAEVSAAETGVEERVITAPPLVQNSQSDGYPPVEDRSIGAPVDSRSTAAPVISGSTSVNRQAQTNYTPGYPASNVPVPTANSNVPTASSNVPIAGPAAAAGGTSVVTIPDASVAVTPSNPQQTQTTIQQQAPLTQQPATQQAAPPQAASPQVASAAPTVLAEQEYYQQGFNLVKQGQFQDAIEVFKQLISNHPGGNLVGDAHYWIGESSFLDRDLNTSKQYFKAFMDSYPQSARVPGAMLRTAYIEQEQGNQMEARILLNEIIQFHPSSDAVHAAKNRLAAIENQNN